MYCKGHKIEESIHISRALKLINQGKYTDAEKIYRQLISLNTQNHLVYSNLAALIGLKGNKNEQYKI